MSIAAGVEDGVLAYARAEYFVAHEAFEQAWLASGPPRSRSRELHALAQVAAAMHKRRAQEKPDAARAIMRRAAAKLAGLDTSDFGVDLEQLRAGVAAFCSDSDAGAPPIRRRR